MWIRRKCVCGRAPAQTHFLVYLEHRECVWWLQMLSYFCWTKSSNWSKCCCFWIYCIVTVHNHLLNSTWLFLHYISGGINIQNTPPPDSYDLVTMYVVVRSWRRVVRDEHLLLCTTITTTNCRRSSQSHCHRYKCMRLSCVSSSEVVQCCSIPTLK